MLWEVLARELERQQGRDLTVVDVGGGTGGFAVPLARTGHRVTVVDPSADALAALTRRAVEAGVAGRVTALQGDGDTLAALVPADGADLVLCHSMLEVVDEPASVVRAVAGAARPGGAVSVLVANRASAVLSRAMGGHLDQAAAMLNDRDGRAGERDTLRRRFDASAATTLLTDAGLTLEGVHGVRVLTDLLPPSVAEDDPATLHKLEAMLSTLPPYRDIAAQLHLLGRRER